MSSCSELEITNKLLIEHNWTPNYGETGFILNFNENNEFKIIANVQSGEGCTGTYIILNNVLIITINNIFPATAELKMYKNKEYKFYLKNSNTSVFYTQYLQCEDDKLYFGNIFWNQDSKVPPNSVRDLDGIKIITTEEMMAQTTDNVFFREKPNVNSRKYKLHIENWDEGTSVDSFFLPIGGKIKILCRSYNKQKIGDLNNYWYYVLFDNVSYLYFEKPLKYSNKFTAWVYGGYIKIIE